MSVDNEGMTKYYVLIHCDPPQFLVDDDNEPAYWVSIFEASLAGSEDRYADHCGYSVLCTGQWILEDGIGE